MSEKLNIFRKLNKARSDFHKLDLKKSGNNKFAGYRYFELGDFIVPAIRVFEDNGLCGLVSFTVDVAKLNIWDVDADFRDGKEGHMVITSPMGSAALKGAHEIQNIGAVETYQRRYLWMAALEIVEHDALDSSEPIKPAVKAIPESSKSIGQSEFDKLAPERKKIIADLSVEIIDTFRDTGQEESYDMYLQAKDNLPLIEEQAALRGLFASNIKTAFVKIAATRKAKFTVEDIINTP